MPAINPPTSGYNAQLSGYNVTESSLRRIRGLIANALTTTSTVRVICAGDSITQGVAGTPQRLFNWPAKLRQIMAADGRAGVVGEGTIIGGGQIRSLYDERITNPDGQFGSSGGIDNSNFFSAAGSYRLIFALPACDTIEIFHQFVSGFTGTWSYSIDGGADVPVSTTGSSRTLSTGPISTSAGTHTLTIKAAPTTGYTIIHGVRYSTAAAPLDVDIVTGGGYSGLKSNQLGSGGVGDFAEVAAALGCDLLIPCFGRNDASSAGGITPAQYKTNMTAMVAAARSIGKECILLTPPPSSQPQYDQEAAIFAALYQIADEQDVALIDLKKRFGTQWNVSPYNISSDDIHPNNQGSYQIASAVANLLLNA